MSEDSLEVTEARRKAELARAKFWGSFDELVEFGHRTRERLRPGHLARDAWDATKSKSVDLAEDAVDAVRKRPIAASGAVAALALFIAREPLMEAASKFLDGSSKKKKKAPKRAAKAPGKPVEKIDE